MDDDLISSAVQRISIPKHAPADSFVLHAPLELLARALLLPLVRPATLPEARARLQWLVETYDAAGERVAEPIAVTVSSTDDAVRRFTAALAAGDLDEVDRLAQWLGTNLRADELRQVLAGVVVTSLAAAAHASILFHLLPRVRAARLGTLLRGPARELARHPDWQLRWFDDLDSAAPATSTLTDALLAVPMLGSPGSDFIYPVMNQAEESGIAPKSLAGLTTTDPTAARRDLARIAALSMLQEPPDHAPYGWSHCLTMPQAVIGLAGRGVPARTAVAVGATYVVGFRAAMGQRALRADYQPAPTTSTALAEAIGDGRDAAAAFVWHAHDDVLDDIVTELATRAAVHHDAHLVKYTLACLDAAHADSAQRRLYLAAAASLSSWWANNPDHSLT